MMRSTFLVFMKKPDSCCCWRTYSPLPSWNHSLPLSWLSPHHPLRTSRYPDKSHLHTSPVILLASSIYTPSPHLPIPHPS